MPSIDLISTLKQYGPYGIIVIALWYLFSKYLPKQLALIQGLIDSNNKNSEDITSRFERNVTSLLDSHERNIKQISDSFKFGLDQVKVLYDMGSTSLHQKLDAILSHVIPKSDTEAK